MVENRLTEIIARLAVLEAHFADIRADLAKVQEFIWETHRGLTRAEKIALASGVCAVIVTLITVVTLLTGSPTP